MQKGDIMSFNELKQHGTKDFPFGIYIIDKDHPKYEMAFHWHTSLEIIRIIKGSLLITLNNKSFTARENDVVFVNPDVVHGATPRNCEYECLVFPLGLLKNGNRSCDRFLEDLADRNCQLAFMPFGEQLKSCVNELFETVKSRENGYRFITIGLVYRLIGLFIKTNQYSYDTDGLTDKDEQKVLKLKRTLAYIRDNFDKEISLDEIAAPSGLSTKYFCCFFKEMTGKSAIEYLNSYRVERACRKLLESDLTVTQIAYGSGFNDLSYFIKTFKKIKGCPPSEYRKTSVFN